MSHIPGQDLNLPDLVFIDKILHGLAYGILAVSLFFASLLNGYKKPYQFAFIISSVYGLSDEIHQVFVPSRSFELFDWGADVIGSVFFLSTLALLERVYGNFKKNSYTYD